MLNLLVRYDSLLQLDNLFWPREDGHIELHIGDPNPPNSTSS